jgi:transposase-like protein
MRTSPCCGVKGRVHGARRLLCKNCGRTWTTRPQKRGRKNKRARDSLAISVMRSSSSLRGMAEQKNTNREKIRRRFHESLRIWLNRKIPETIPAKKPLIAIVDAMWFKLGRRQKRYTSFAVLLRPVDEEYATLVLLDFLPGTESKENWIRVLDRIPENASKRIVALVSDGFVGLITIAEEKGWHFQWCHIHIKRRILELRGVRKIPGVRIRRRVTKLIYLFLETSNHKSAQRSLREIEKLFIHPDCPKSIPRRLSGIIKRTKYFRTYRDVPELNLPISTNSAENINSQIMSRLSSMRGLRSSKSLKFWIAVMYRSIKPVRCRGYKNTEKYHRKSVS